MNTASRQQLATIGAVGLAFLTLMAAMALRPENGAQVAVIANPFRPFNARTVARLVAQSGGEMIATSGDILIAKSDRADFIPRLYRNGAILVFNPRIIAGCQSI